MDLFPSGRGREPAPLSMLAGRLYLSRMIDVTALAAELVAMPSVAGSEQTVVDRVARLLVGLGWNVGVHEVTPGRGNVWASRRGGSGSSCAFW